MYTPKTALPINVGYAPSEGPKGMPFVASFAAQADFDINFLIEESIGQIAFIQSVWIDNSQNANGLTITWDLLGQVIAVKKHTQGTYPVIAGKNPTCRISSTAGDYTAKLIFLNIPLPFATWETQ